MASQVHAGRVGLLFAAAWLALNAQASRADQATRLAAIRPFSAEDAPAKEPRVFAAPPPSAFTAAWFASPAPMGALSTLSCLAALLSCACSMILWRRVDGGQEAAKASMYAAGKLFDTAARRFARSQDEAGSAVDAAASAAGRAGQAAARLAAAVRETEARLSACLGEAEARLHAAAGLLAQYDSTAAAFPAVLAGSLHTITAAAVPVIEEASLALRRSAEENAAATLGALRKLPDLLTESLATADARSAACRQNAGEMLHSRADIMALAAAALPVAGPALGEASAHLALAQAQSAALLARIEALAGVLPNIATSLASTAAGHRQLLCQGRQDVESGIEALRQAASSLSASVDEAGVLMRATAERAPAFAPSRIQPALPSPSMHPALRPRDLSPVVRRYSPQDAIPEAG